MQLLADLENNKMFSDDLECQKLLMEAMKYHLLPERRPMFQSPRTKPRKSTVGALYAVGGMDATKGIVAKHHRSGCSLTARQVCLHFNIFVVALRLHHDREVRPADQYLGPGRSHERTQAAVWRRGYRQQALCGRREGWTQDIQHGGVLQSDPQSVVYYAPHVNTQAWPR